MATTNLIKRLQNIMRRDAGISGDAQRIEQMVWILFLKVYDTQEAEWEYKALRTNATFQSIIPEKYRWRNWAHAKDAEGKDIGTALTGDALLDFIQELFAALKGIAVTPETPMRQAIVQEVFADLNQYQKNGILLRQVVNVIDEIDFTDAEDRHTFGDIYEGILKDLQSAGNAGEFYTPRALTDFIVSRLSPRLGERFGDFSSGTGGFLTSALSYLAKQVKTVEDRDRLQHATLGQEWKPLPYLLSITNLLLHRIDEPNILHMDSLGRRLRDWKPDCDVIGMNPPYGGSTETSVKSNFPAEFQTSETADLFLLLIMQRLKHGGRAGVIIPDGFLSGTDGAKLAIKRKLVKDFNLHTVVRLPGSIFAPYTGIATNILFFDRPEATPEEGTLATKDIWFYRLDMPEGIKHFSKTKPMRLEHCAPILDWWCDRKEIVGEDTGDKSRKFSVEDILASDCNLDLCKFPVKQDELLPPKELMARYHQERQEVDAGIDAVLSQIAALLHADSGECGFAGAKTFGELEERRQKLDAALPEALEKSILQEAIQGRLVPQNPGDEPASELLKRVAAERKALVKAGKLKRDKDESVIFRGTDGQTYETRNGETTCIEEDLPFEIPASWEWARLGSICSVFRGSGIKRSETTQSGYPCIRYGEIYTTYGYSFQTAKSFTTDAVASKSIKANSGDVLCTLTGECKEEIAKATAYLGETPIAIGGDLARISHHPYNPMLLVYFLFSPFMLLQKAEKSNGDIIVHIGKDAIERLLIPLPPRAEQDRIAAKVADLLATIRTFPR